MGYAGRVVEGARVPLYGRFYDLDGTPTDPATMIMRVMKPDATVQVYRQPSPGAGELPLTQESTGVWYGEYIADVPGVTWFRWETTGDAANVDEDYIYVDPSRVV